MSEEAAAPIIEQPIPEVEAPQVEEQAPEEVTITIGEESPPPEENRAPDWVRELRKSHRELQRKNRELEDRLKTTEPKPVALGQKPALSDFDYDTERFETALEDWYRKRDEVERINAARRAEEENQHKAWADKLRTYDESKTTLRVNDYEDAEAIAQEMLSVTQQGVLIAGCENPALVVYALGKNPKKAKELAAITDPVKFAFAVAKLETQLKVNRKTPPPVMKTVSGTGPVSGSVDSTLERLREEAARTGDMSKVFKYKQQLRQKT
ncbi:MAG: hypothetical protein EBR82_43355 [Caulobacteraceae bacterium]|nr:hypothetical protein [Caulobacteraceae bacterium]NDG19124.1 hypothetical protein [Betaproteobacteria bacterium]